MQKENIVASTISLLAYENEARLFRPTESSDPSVYSRQGRRRGVISGIGEDSGHQRDRSLIACPRPLNPGSVLTLTVPAPSLTLLRFGSGGNAPDSVQSNPPTRSRRCIRDRRRVHHVYRLSFPQFRGWIRIPLRYKVELVFIIPGMDQKPKQRHTHEGLIFISSNRLPAPQ